MAAAALVALVQPPAVAATVAVLVVDGTGFGHGVGMAQDGALAMGRQGASTEQILGHFFPGTQLGTATGPVRVVVLTSSDRETVVTFPGGGEVRSPLQGTQAAGFPVRVQPGGSVRLRFDGRYRAEPVAGATVAAQAVGLPVVVAQLPPLPGGTTTTTAPSSSSTSSTTTTTAAPLTPPTFASSTTATTAPPRAGSTTTAPGSPLTTAPGAGSATTTTAPPAAAAAVSATPLFALPVRDATVGVPGRGAQYRGYVEATAAAGPLRLVNSVDVEQYLRGMGEVRDPRWPAVALRAQAVAARTYALRAMALNGEICDTQRCQVYLGQHAEYPEMDAAVAATRGWVVGFGGGLATTVYSASGGGMSATTAEGFGTPDGAYPYLRAIPYPTDDPKAWTRTVALSDVAGRLGYAGELTGVQVTSAGPSGRALTVELTGSAGAVQVTGLQLGRALALPSTRWSTRVATADVAPPPPPPPVDPAAVTGQALPEDVGTVIAQDVARASAAQPGEDPGAPDLPPWVPAVLVGAIVVAGLFGLWTLVRATRP